MTDDPLISPAEVRAMFPGRWRTDASLAAGTRSGTAPGGRVPVSANRAAYRLSAVLEFKATEEGRRAELRTQMQARAAHARATWLAMPAEERRRRQRAGRQAEPASAEVTP